MVNERAARKVGVSNLWRNPRLSAAPWITWKLLRLHNFLGVTLGVDMTGTPVAVLGPLGIVRDIFGHNIQLACDVAKHGLGNEFALLQQPPRKSQAPKAVR